MSDRFKTLEAFRAALTARVKKESALTGRSVDRLIQLHLMQRFVARVLAAYGDLVTIKGGLALELRLDQARTTRDIDVRMSGSREGILEQLQRIGADVSTVDRLSFTTIENPTDAEIDGDGVIYEGLRFRTQGHLGAKPYGAAFGVDVAFGDPMTGTRDSANAPNLLDIVDAPVLTVPLYPIETHLAEKVHAYTLPRKHTNHRIKDLIDLALIAGELAIVGATFREALERTFTFRKSHPLPASLPPPPEAWVERYPRVQRENGLVWPTLDEVHAAAARFVDPVLAGGAASWDPAAQAWR